MRKLILPKAKSLFLKSTIIRVIVSFIKTSATSLFDSFSCIIHVWNEPFFFSLPLFHLFSICLRTSVVPYRWKTAIIHPISKVRTTLQPSDMRPISALPFFLARLSAWLSQNTFFFHFETSLPTSRSRISLHIYQPAPPQPPLLPSRLTFQIDLLNILMCTSLPLTTLRRATPYDIPLLLLNLLYLIYLTLFIIGSCSFFLIDFIVRVSRGNLQM